MNPSGPIIGTGDRLCFTAFLAAVLHALLILGVGFTIHQKADNNPVIEVTLTHTPSREAPKQADYMAEENQLGAGELEEKATPSITEQSEFIDQLAQPVSVETPAQSTPQPADQQLALITTLGESSAKDPRQEQDQAEPNELSELNREISLLEKSLALASRDAQLDVREQLQTRDTRIKKVSSVSALKASDAYYVKQWIEKIYRIGKLNYPEEARRRKIFGNLRLTVVLIPNGSVKDIRVLRSSGHKVLDDAAIRIVRLAAPFAPFPEQLKLEYDQLEITRTWQFTKDGHSSVH